MLKLDELSGDELEAFIAMYSGEDMSPVNNAIARIDNLEKSIKRAEEELKAVRELLSKRDYEKVCDKAHRLSYDFGKMSTQLRSIPYDLGFKENFKPSRTGIPDYQKQYKDVKFIRHTNHYEIIIPEMLPHKIHIDVSTMKTKYEYDIESWRANYIEAFSRQFANGKMNLMSEKASICYLIHVSPNMKKGVPDTDNYDTKVMTDIINGYILKDDDFMCCNCFVDVIVDHELKGPDDAFTQIVVCEAKKREEVLDWIYCIYDDE